MSSIIVNGLVYPIHQINGQRISGPPQNLVLPGNSEPTADTNEVFVTNIPRELFEADLLPVFAQCGPIYKFRLMMCFSGANRGFAYILYVYPQSVQCCLKWFRHINTGEKIMYVHPSCNKRVLVMGRVDSSVMNVEYFCMSLTKCVKVERLTGNNQKKPTYHLYYETHYDAAMARREFMLHMHELGENCYVRWQTPKF